MSFSRKRRRLLLLLLIIPILLIGFIFILFFQLDRIGWDFYNTGKGGAERLQEFAVSLKDRDGDGIRSFYSESFAGSKLGLNERKLLSDEDQIGIYALQSDGSEQSASDATAEWIDYLEGFESIEEVRLHIHRMESWDAPAEPFIASVRFELIGKPKDGKHAGIDRAYFRFHFAPEEETLRITAASLISGDRIIRELAQPAFVNVAKEAGVDFENMHYPGYLQDKLPFGMIRYGPGGISAVDYNNDGFHDIFIPDGVESRFFRNLADGRFQDVTEEAGLSGLDGCSVAVFGDYDNDGWKDLFVNRGFGHNQLFHNNGDGTFRDVTAASGVGADSCATVASWADYNNDGYLDLYVGRYLDPRERLPTTFYARNGEPNQLYRNNGDGTFTNVTEEAGVGEVGLCLGTVFGDYDDDGDQDLYVSNDFGRKTLYRNNGDNTFTDVTVETNTLAYGAGMSSTIGDYDNDLDLDFYVAHIRSEEGWFAEWPTVCRYVVNSFRQGVWVTDMPLYWEIFMQSGFGFIQVFQDMASGNTLLRNDGDGTFTDVSWEASANPIGWFWGTNFADFNNNGWQDLYAANGWVYNDQGTEIELEFLSNVVTEQQVYKTGKFFDPEHFGNLSWHGWERNRYMHNNKDGTFTEMGRATNTDLILNSRGTAVADFWNRGVLDLAVAACLGKHALLRNEMGGEGNWIAIELEGAAGRLPDGMNRDAVGARAYIKSGESRQMREVVLGDGYGSQSTLRLHFGLGDLNQVDELVIRWPRSDKEQAFTKLTANKIYRVVEDEANIQVINYSSPTQ
jgi:hypothetical protein